MFLERPLRMPMHPERSFPFHSRSGERSREWKAVSGRFGVISEIVVLSGRLRDVTGRDPRATLCGSTLSYRHSIGLNPPLTYRTSIGNLPGNLPAIDLIASLITRSTSSDVPAQPDSITR